MSRWLHGQRTSRVAPAGAVVGRSHPQYAGGFLVEASTRIKARLIDSLGYTFTVFQTLTDLRCAMRGGIFLWRQPRRRLEHAMEIAGAAANGIGEIVQGRFLLALLDQTACAG